jgi:peptidoglycan/LPS O-acetylase OafA/YrhL
MNGHSKSPRLAAYFLRLLNERLAIPTNVTEKLGSGTTSSPKHLQQLDGLRGLAAICVVIAHYRRGPIAIPAGSFAAAFSDFASRYSIGNLSVAFFFSLSSFLLTYLAITEFSRTNHFSIKRFFLRRILRIWPLYYFVFVVLLVIFAHPDNMYTDFGASPDFWLWLKQHLGIYTLFVSNWSLTFNQIGGHYDPSPSSLRIFWSIAVEEQFYLLYPFIMLAAFRFPRARLLFASILLLMGLAFRVWFSSLPVGAPDIRNAGGMYYATLTYMDIILIGGICGWFFGSRQHSLGSSILGNRWLGLLLIIAGMSCGRIWSNNIWYPYTVIGIGVYTFMGCVFGLLLIWVSVMKMNIVVRFLSSTPLRILGSLSFGIYMWHEISSTVLAAVIDKSLTMSPLLGEFWIRLSLTVLSATAFAAIGRVFIEVPFLKLKNRFQEYSGLVTSRN